MQIRNLGGSGLRVSAVGLGCNNFGQRTDLETSRKVIHKAIDLGVTLFDTADIYAGDGRLRDRAGPGARRPPQGHRAGDEIFQADEQRRHQAGRVAALHHVGGRGQPDAAEDRLHRSLPAARLRSADADRGNPARAGRPDPAGQGALHRQFEFSGMAPRRGRTHRARHECQPVRVVPGRIQPGGARYRKGSAAGGAGIQARPAAVLPARQRTC